METREYVMDVIEQSFKLLEDVFTSGFLSVHDETVSDLKKISDLCMQCGLIFAGEAFHDMYMEIISNKHRMHQEYQKVAELFCNLERYLTLCKKRLEIEGVKANLE